MTVSSVDRPAALWTRDFLLLLGANMAFYSGFQLLLASMPLYAVDLGGGEAAAGLVTGLFTLAALTVRPFTGWMVDVYDRRGVLLLGLAACLVAILGHEWAATLGLLVLARMVNGVGFGMATTAMGTVAADLIPRTRLGEGMGYFTASMGLPLAVAPLLGIWMANRGNFTALFLLAAGITGVALVFSWVMRVPHRQRPDVGERGLKISSMFERTALLPASLMFLLLVTFGLILALLALYGKERGIASVGAWFTVYAIALTAARGLTGRPADRWGYRQMAALGFVLAAAGLVVVSMADNLWILLLSAVIYGLGYGTTQPSLQALLIARSPAAQRGAATAVFFFAYDLGTTLGSIGGGILAGVIGLSAVFALSALCPVVGIAVLLIHLRRVPLPRVA